MDEDGSIGRGMKSKWEAMTLNIIDEVKHQPSYVDRKLELLNWAKSQSGPLVFVGMCSQPLFSTAHLCKMDIVNDRVSKADSKEWLALADISIKEPMKRWLLGRC